MLTHNKNLEKSGFFYFYKNLYCWKIFSIFVKKKSYIMDIIDELTLEIIKLVKTNHNDQDLGKKVRELINNTIK
jgi:hypothetical protein